MVAEVLTDTVVCSTCGTQVGRAKRDGRLVHLGEIPKAYAEHDAEAVDAAAFAQAESQAADLALAALDLLAHHATLCPATSCPFAAAVKAALHRQG